MGIESPNHLRGRGLEPKWIRTFIENIYNIFYILVNLVLYFLKKKMYYLYFDIHMCIFFRFIHE